MLPSKQVPVAAGAPPVAFGSPYRHYPPPEGWNGDAEAGAWESALAALGARADDGVAIEVHLPFCATRCLYCGCDIEPTSDEATIETYVDALVAQMDHVAAHLGHGSEAVHVHFGGGTPNHVGSEHLERLVAAVREHFRVPADADWSIECDPRRCSATQMDELRRVGFRHLRFGMGDLQQDVQLAVGRLQSWALMDDVMSTARHARFDSLQLDLVYGLPLQTEKRLRATLDALIRLGPDRVQGLPYLHQPSRFWTQCAIDASTVPEAAMRDRLWRIAVDTLTEAGYAWIGADLFVLEDDALEVARQRGELRRSALGYATVPTAHLLAFGHGRVSEIGPLLVCSDASRTRWQQAQMQGRWGLVRSHRRSAAERRVQRAIAQLQCDLQLPAGSAVHGLEREYERLIGCASHGWVVAQGDRLRVTRSGHYRLDALCAIFDGAAPPGAVRRLH